MSDTELLLLIESRKKSGWIAAILNLIIPGAGYMYCGRWFLGLVALALVVAMVITVPLASAGIVLVLFIDGFLSAGRHNKNLVTKIIKERSSLGRAAEGAA
ncbi:MAG TPA: hypothetical protein VLB90_00860 [Pseudomonadales bacterium]|nr:hypothetical protein [Pseudomonadales bacterium]